MEWFSGYMTMNSVFGIKGACKDHEAIFSFLVEENVFYFRNRPHGQYRINQDYCLIGVCSCQPELYVVQHLGSYQVSRARLSREERIRSDAVAGVRIMQIKEYRAAYGWRCMSWVP